MQTLLETPDRFYAFILLISSMSILVTFGIVLTRRHIPAARPLLVMLISIFMWTFMYAMMWVSEVPQERIFWLDLLHIGAVIVPASLFVFVLHITDRTQWINWRMIALLSVIPIISIVGLFTDSYHGLFFAGKRTMDMTNYTDGGTLFWLMMFYSYLLVVFAIVLLAERIIYASTIYRRQAIILLISVTIPLSANFFGLAGIIPYETFDLTPILFMFTSIFLVIGMFTTNLLEVTPIARSNLIDHLREALFVVDMKNRVIDANREARKLLPEGFPIIGAHMSEVFDQWNTTNEVLASPTSVRAEMTLKRDDEIRLYSMNISPLETNGTVTGHMILLHDTTLQHRTEVQRKQLEVERERLRMISDFVETASHEFRTPLTIINNSSYLAKRVFNDKKLDKYLSTITEQVSTMSELVTALMLWVRVNNDLTPTLHNCDMNKLLMSITESTSQLQKEHRVGVNLTLPSQHYIAQGSYELLESAIQGLVHNAIRYTMPGGRNVDISCQHSDGMLDIIIRDYGIGMETKELQSSMEAFFRADSAHSTPGFGLGLPIAHKVIQMHNGILNITSEKGNGTTVKISLSATPATKKQQLSDDEIQTTEMPTIKRNLIP